MHELIHIVEHTLGICGEKHLSILAVMTEWPNFSPILSYIKTLFK